MSDATSPCDTRPIVGVIGDGTLADDSPRADRAHRLGKALVEDGYRIACGGLGGVMQHVCRGARQSSDHRPGTTIGILPGSEPQSANPWIDTVIPTNLSHARNTLVAQSEAVVALGGGAGTLSEMSFAWIMDRLIVAFEVEGWSGRLAGRRLDDRERFSDIEEDRVFGVSTVGEVIDGLSRRLEAYRRARQTA